MRHHKEVICETCEFPDDLEWFDGHLLCVSCRTCKHGWLGKESIEDLYRRCPECLRDAFTNWSFYGPLLMTPETYFDYAEEIGVSLGSLLTWNSYEEEALQDRL